MGWIFLCFSNFAIRGL